MTEPAPQPNYATTAAANNRLDRLTGWFDRLVPFRQLRPLSRVPSLKLKLSILILAAIGISVGAVVVGFWIDVRPAISLAVAIVIALAMVQFLARGLTQPVRAMADAADEMANGDYHQQIVVTSSDEIGQLAASFNLMAAHIAELEQQHRDLIANVSHELRTPLAVLHGSLENLLDGVEAATPNKLEIMARQTARLTRLVSQLLDLSRLDAGVAPLHLAPMDLMTVIDDVVDEARLREPPPDLVTDGPASLSIVGDPERLHQLLANLVDNAIRHSPAGEPIVLTARLEPEIDAASDAGAIATVTVQDRGPGIPGQQIDQIFDRFRRVGPSDVTPRAPTSNAPTPNAPTPNDVTSGVGLGLAISRWVAELHHGSLIAINTNPGCCFTLSMPLPEPAPPDDRAAVLRH